MSDERGVEWSGAMEHDVLVPKQIITEVSRTCNLRCVGCPINADSHTGRAVFMDVDYFKSIVDRIDFQVVLIPWMNGEPLMHPDYHEMVKYVTDRKIPMYITTNGHFWNEELFDHITDDTSCYQIIFSLDGLPGSKSIKAARPGSNPDRVVDTICGFLNMRDRKSAKIDVAVKIVQRGQDWEEVEDYILYWLDRGVSYVCEGRMLSEHTDSPMRRYPCQYFDNNFMVIRHDGELVLCAYNSDVVNNGANPLFTLDRETPLLDAYNDPRYQKYRDLQRKGTYVGPCVNCGFAYTGQGMDGTVRFRSDPSKEIFYRRDYYNSFYSLNDRYKARSYYKDGATVADAGSYYV